MNTLQLLKALEWSARTKVDYGHNDWSTVPQCPFCKRVIDGNIENSGIHKPDCALALAIKYESTNVPLYLVVQEDRHYDVKILPFHNKEAAITKAKQIAQSQIDSWPGRVLEVNNFPHLLYHARYSCEGDMVYVQQTEFRDQQDIVPSSASIA